MDLQVVKVFISPSFLTNNFIEYRILSWHFFPFSTWRISFLFLLLPVKATLLCLQSLFLWLLLICSLYHWFCAFWLWYDLVKYLSCCLCGVTSALESVVLLFSSNLEFFHQLFLQVFFLAHSFSSPWGGSKVGHVIRCMSSTAQWCLPAPNFSLCFTLEVFGCCGFKFTIFSTVMCNPHIITFSLWLPQIFSSVLYLEVQFVF